MAAVNEVPKEPVKGAFNLETCARPNILALKPYRCARDDYKDDGTNVLLDANENAFGPGLKLDAPSGSGAADIDLLGLHRYPDPHQIELKQLMCNLRNNPAHNAPPLTPEHLFVGVGSDEAIDALLRCFCRPGIDKILTCAPTYGMYSVSAQINDVEVVNVPQKPATAAGQNSDPENPAEATTTFAIPTNEILAKLTEDPSIKLIYLTSPGNPTGQLVPPADVTRILQHPTWNGVLIIDEAYIDFATPPNAPADQVPSLAPAVPAHPNLVVLQTLSKAFGLAGIRVGFAFCAAPVAALLNALKAPYNLSAPASALAARALQPASLAVTRANVALILTGRDKLVAFLKCEEGVMEVLDGRDANFLMVRLGDRRDKPGRRASNRVAGDVYGRLAENKGVVVRYRGQELGCEGCLRITVGTDDEIQRFEKAFHWALASALSYEESLREAGV